MIALIDIGNTHTHIGLANATRVGRHIDIPTKGWGTGPPNAPPPVLKKQPLAGVALSASCPR